MSGKHVMHDGADPSGQDAHNPETEEDTASGGPAVGSGGTSVRATRRGMPRW